VGIRSGKIIEMNFKWSTGHCFSWPKCSQRQPTLRRLLCTGRGARTEDQDTVSLLQWEIFSQPRVWHRISTVSFVDADHRRLSGPFTVAVSSFCFPTGLVQAQTSTSSLLGVPLRAVSASGIHPWLRCQAAPWLPHLHFYFSSLWQGPPSAIHLVVKSFSFLLVKWFSLLIVFLPSFLSLH
jgi:hypothetical protein